MSLKIHHEDEKELQITGTDWDLLIVQDVCTKMGGTLNLCPGQSCGYYTFPVEASSEIRGKLDELNKELKIEDSWFPSTETIKARPDVYTLDEKTIETLKIRNPRFQRFKGHKLCYCNIKNNLRVCLFCQYACCEKATKDFIHQHWVQCETHGKTLLEKVYR
jgi:hypothetical protein